MLSTHQTPKPRDTCDRAAERVECTRALAQTRSVGGAAELLGISRRELLQRVVQLGITCKSLDEPLE